MELVIATIFLALIFDYTNGFHDAANVVSTVIATKALAPLTAILMATFLNFAGATQISGVAQTIATGLIKAEEVSQLAVLAAVGGAISWNIVTWYWGIPSSSSYALIGGLIGAAWTQQGIHVILWEGFLEKVCLPMLFSPCLGFLFSLLFMKGIYASIANRLSPRAQKAFQHLQIGSASFVALSHGLNDAQKSMGLITLALFSGGVIQTTQIPLWVIFSCAGMIALGTASGGFRIIQTMGFSITKLSPAQGFAAETSASLVILVASFLGMPISSTHVIAGGITGVGTAKSIHSVHWKTPRKIILAWLITLPGAGFFSVVLYYAFHLI